MHATGGHTVVHGLLTTLLALAYAVVVIALAAQLSILGGGSGLAVSVATLVATALLWPAWRRLQQLLNRRLARQRP